MAPRDRTEPADEPAATASGEEPLPAPFVLGVALVLTALLSVWAAFLVPLRLGGVPLPAWLVPLAGMLAAASWAGRRVGPAGALVPAALWLAVSWLAFGSTRAEGDLVVPGSLSGYAYLFGGLVLWVVVVARASAATPGGGARR